MKTKSIGKMIFIIMAMFCLLASFFNLSIGMRFASAEEVRYTSVLEDLQKDENFNATDYPVDSDDYSLKVIQIAESVNEELFVYVYQPSTDIYDFVASKITISINDPLSENKSYAVVDLELLSNTGVFYKYLLVNFCIPTSPTRYYEITEIFRPWDEDLDEPSENENTISHVPYEVAKLYTFEGYGDEVNITCVAVKTIEILDKYVGFVRYEGGYTWDALTYESCDNHFVAFSTDYQIDNLLEAELTYSTRSYYYYHLQSMTQLTTPTVTYGDVTSHKIELSYDDEESYQGNIFHKKYTWDKISTVNDFIANENHDDTYHVVLVDVRKQTSLTNEGVEDLKGMQWVLRFATTEYSYKEVGVTQGGVQLTDITTEINSTQVMDVSVLRLKFETEGEVYNLGVVDNMQTGDGNPDNKTNTTAEPPDWLQALIDFLKDIFSDFGKAIMFVLYLILIIVASPWIFKAIWWILKGVWWLIKAPFMAIKNLIDKGRK